MGHQHEAVRGGLRVHGARLPGPPPHLAQVRRAQSEGSPHPAGQKGRRNHREPSSRRGSHARRTRHYRRTCAGCVRGNPLVHVRQGAQGHPRHRHRQPSVPRRRIPGLALQYRLLPRLCGCGAGAGLAHRREAREHGAAQPPCRAQVLRPRRKVHMDRRVPLSRRQTARPLRGQGHPRGRGHHLRRVELRLYRRAHERHRPRLHRLYGHGPRRHGLHARGHGERGAHRAAQLHG